MMRKISGLLLVVTILLFYRPLFSQELVRVVVLPFEINAQGDLAYLSGEISKVLKDGLSRAGAVNVAPAETIDPKAQLTLDGLRRIGADSGADYVIWGSFTRIGDRFSIDVKLLETSDRVPPRSLYGEGTGMENLLKAVRRIGLDLEVMIFRREKIARIEIAGNKRIESDAIRRKIQTSPGDIYLAKNLSRDLKAVYQMGYFEDIRIESEDGPEGKIVIFKVTEKPTVRFIRVKGAKRGFKEDEVKENLDIKTGSILNIFKIRRNVQRIENLYKEKNYHNVKVSYEILPLDNNQADLEFIIDEGEKVKIKTISFEGNRAFSAKELKKLIKTSEKGLFSFITQSGELNPENLEQDVAILTAFYQNNGYIQARVGEPVVDFRDDWIYVTFKIDEGLRFKTGKIDIEGDLLLSKEKMLERLGISGQEYYNREVVRNDVLSLKEIYSDEGYANADILPRINRNMEGQTVDITYAVNKGNLVYFEKIVISGNSKTRDKVIRRELSVYEEELFSGRRMKRGIQNLYRLDYFEDVKVNTSRGSADDRMVLNLDVTEKATGAFTFGGGYSTTEGFYVTGSISQRNLFGRGQVIGVEGQVGGRTTRYNLSFTEPWLFDIPLSAGVDLYSWLYEYNDYDKDSTGTRLRGSYPVADYTRAYLTYTYDLTDVKNIADTAANSIKELVGQNVTSSLTGEVVYDSRDRRFNASRGSRHSASVEYAGGFLGGDIAFTKYLAETGWYFPIWWKHVLFLHGEGGLVTDNGEGLVPDYERFYLGGMNSVRGFEYQDIHAVDENGDTIGGNTYIQGNIEYLVPLFKEAGIVGLLFLDAGGVYGKDENIDLDKVREGYGGGIRWYSPIGPIRLEYGIILDPLPGESTGGRFEFAMGSAF